MANFMVLDINSRQMQGCCAAKTSASAQRSKSTLFLRQRATAAKYLTEASTNTVVRLTGYDTLTKTHVLAR